ncbi:hypothetical protein PGT21_033778 [Puccinia graminis f. sp. tritici]|uniref:Uncharacterized protein n=1 Tax=Puccinia graminis f. sp. tritici TaxID=56615 RepID=A0A5B0R493_PUCGR|nr:hypothetical protein PGT21_033778 [Puccinia graminis f. sp. tritici]
MKPATYLCVTVLGSAYSAVRWKSIENLPTGADIDKSRDTSGAETIGIEGRRWICRCLLIYVPQLNISSRATVLLPRKFVLVRRDPHHFAGPEQVIRFNLDGIFNIPEDKHEHPADDATRNHEQTSSAGFC